MALPVNQSFEGGPSGTTISTANSGTSPDTAFNAIGSGTGTTEAYSSAVAAHGSLSGVMQVGSTSAAAYVSWTSTALGTISAVSYGRAYFSISSLTMTGDAIVAFLNGSTYGGGIQLGGITSGKLNFQNTAFSQTNTFTTTCSVSTWYRIEWQVTPGASAAGRLVVKLFLGDATTALETQTSTTGVYGSSTSWNAIRFGWGSAGANHASQPALYFDDLNVNSTGYPGPAQTTNDVSDTDDSGSTADSAGTVTAVLTALDLFGPATDSAGTVVASSSGTDTAHGTDQGETVHATVPVQAETGHGTDAGETVLPIVPVTSTETGHGTDAGENVNRAFTAAETSTSAETGTTTAHLSSSDISASVDGGAASAAETSAETGHGADAGEKITLSSAEAGTGTDTGFVSGQGLTVTDTETGHGEDSAFTHIISTETGHGTDAGERYGPADTDTGHGTDIELTRFVADTDLSTSSEAGFWSGTFSDNDTSLVLDAGETVTVHDSEFSVMTDTYIPGIDVYTYEAQFMIAAPGGGFLLVHENPRTGEHRVVLKVDQIDGTVLKLARMLSASASVEFPQDSDHGGAEECQEPTVAVRVSVGIAVEVTAELTREMAGRSTRL